MRLNFSTSWIFQGWITLILVSLHAQSAESKSLQCDDTQYSKGNRCCNKCEPGFRVYSHCDDSQQTKCMKCARGEYQPTWTQETRCLQHKFCDTGKGFMSRPENLVAEEPCRCVPNFQCSLINCEYCEQIPTCPAGFGLELEPESTNGRKICAPCKKGFYSAENNAKECKQWTDCKSGGKLEARPGSAEADAVCGPAVSGAAPSWVIVSVLSVITILCLLILLLFCYKDKLKLLSVNLRSCVQNLKRTRIQQETLAPLYQSGASGPPKSSPCETTKLVYQAPCKLIVEPPSSYPFFAPYVKVSLPPTEETTETEGTVAQMPKEKRSVPEEVSEDDEVGTSASPLLAGSCVCGIPVQEPLEVGENEDCSQAVTPGIIGSCSCGGLDAEEQGNQEEKVPGKENITVTPNDGEQERCTTSGLVSTSAPELCQPLLQKAPVCSSELMTAPQDSREGFSTDSSGSNRTSRMTSPGPQTMSSSLGDLYTEKTLSVTGPEKGQGLSWQDGKGNKLLSEDSELDYRPESLQSQLADPNLTSGQVSGSHNTTFISSGQVMNFSGDVIVVYVSQMSLGSDGAGRDDDFGSPVQEEANETALFSQSSTRTIEDSLQDQTLPIQEVMEHLVQVK
ncbi:uncharacterized protein tnfrsf11a [Neosynchiropus ocellatus]